MANIRSLNELVLSMIDFFKIAQPDLDMKPGTVARDLAIDAPANQIALLYDELAKISNQQSIRLVIGSDLDKLAKNFGQSRKQAIASTGVALLTFPSIPASININKGGIITANNGFAFQVVNGISVLPNQSNFYKSIATKFQNDLNFVGISDQYAVQVSVQATTPGSSGDISKYSLNRTTIPGISNVTNVNPFIGGSDQEDDASFRNRILSIFSGSSIGTALGYKNTALATTGVIDAFVVQPGDPLMTRDGSIVILDASGNLTIVSEGTGGKVDVVILGSNLAQNVDSFIYRDLSNTNDPTNSKNIFILGQIVGDVNKTFNQKRISDISAGTLPAQPVDSIVQVTGSLSGSNFQQKTVDSLGRVSGNYELISDTSIYAGSPWGFDSFHWISNNIYYNEDRIKGKFNGQDSLTFSGVIQIPEVQQNISITNENSIVLNTDRSLIQLSHTPATSITRVFNVNTGERYTIANQNPNGSGSINTSGIVKISGNTLPNQSDVLQVDYNWIITYDQYSDYDGRVLTDNTRLVDDSIDWGYSNLVRNEKIIFSKDITGNFFIGASSLPITSIISASQFTEADGYISTVSSGTFAGRLALITNNLFNSTNSVEHVYFKNTSVELYNTPQANGAIINATVVSGITLQYTTTIVLPTDTKAILNDRVVATLNSTDTFNTINSNGNFTGNQITIPAANIITNGSSLSLNVVYIANIQNIINTSITSVPFNRIGNGFSLNSNNSFNNYYVSNISRRENQAVQKNLSNQFYIELNLSNLDSLLTKSNVISVIRLSDGKELWNRDFPGTVAVNSLTNNYQLIFAGNNTPTLTDRVLAIYSSNDIQRFQPFTFSNSIFERDFANLQLNVATNSFIVPMHSFTNETSINFQILEPNTNIVLATANDGVLLSSSDGSTATFHSSAINFSTMTDGYGNIVNILLKKIRLLNCINRNNSNSYDITALDSLNNVITCKNNFSKISNNQISIIRVLDGQELWSNSGVIDLTNNLLTFPATSAANSLDLVYINYFNINNIKQAPTKLGINISDQIVNSGTISVAGTTITKATDIVFAATTSSLKQNIFPAIRLALGLNSNVSIPSNIKLVKIAKLERVSTTNSSSNDVLEVRNSYDILGSTIADNTFFSNNFARDQSLGNFDFVLPNTLNNENNLSSQVSSGDKFRITFYYSTTNDLENVIFTKNGIVYTNKNFALIDRVYISSGFGSSQSAKITISNFNQPTAGSRYTANYNYLAPKQNERIIINYNYNKLVSDTTFNIETNRPINADVLARQAQAIKIDATLNIVISSQYISSQALVLQNVKDKLIATINASGMGSYLDSSSLINAAFSITGVSGARIQYFNKTGILGSISSVQAHNDQYFSANVITVNQVAV